MAMRIMNKDDFFDGGIFSNIDIPTKLPLPPFVLHTLYGDFNDCDRFIPPKSSQMGLLKQMWKLKGFEMEWCLCKTDHLVPIEEYTMAKRNLSVSQLSKEFFTEICGCFYGKMDLNCTKPPLPDFVIKKILFYFMMDYYNSIPEGECFKSTQYHLTILRKIFWMLGHSSKICNCSFGTHLVLQ